MSQTPRCPASVITAAVLLFVYGGLLLMCSICGAAETALLVAGGNQPGNPNDLLAQERELARRIPSYTAVEGGLHLLNLLLGVTMILAGLGALYLKPIARRAGNAAVGVDLLLSLVHTAYAAIVVMPVNDQLLQEEAQNMPFNVVDIAQAATWGTLAFAAILTLAFNVSILLFLNTQKSRDAFAGKFEPDPFQERLAKFDELAEDDDEYGRRRRSPPGEPGDTGFTK